jgi:proline dehydrogenase
MGMARRSLLWASQSEWLARKCQTWAFTRRASRRFLPGENLESALAAVRNLEERGIVGLITLLGENVTGVDEAKAVARQYTVAFDEIRARGSNCQLSVKPTQLGMDVDGEVCLEQLATLLEHVGGSGHLVWVDMESSAYVQRTLDLVDRVRQTHQNVGVCVQAYLHRTESDLGQLLALGVPVRLVKGAYKEPADLAIQRKTDVDASYLQLARRLLDHVAAERVGFPAFGTHDMTLVRSVKQYATELGISKQAFEFQMLYGIGRDHQTRLMQEGFSIRVLISYGSAWFRWYMRRLAERPANVWFVVRSLLP